MKTEQASPFVHLRVHSSYSLLEGAITPKDLVALCQKHVMPAVAVSDSGNLFGSLEFSMACTAGGVQPIIGCSIQIDMELEKKSFQQAPLDNILLLAKDQSGYQNLLKLVSRSFLDHDSAMGPHISFSQLNECHEGLIVLTGNVSGPLGRLLLSNQADEAELALKKLSGVFTDRLYVELMRHGLQEEQMIEPALIEMAYKLNIPLVATNDVYFSGFEMHEAHDALLCIAEGRYLDEEDRRKVTQEHFFKSPRQMRELFSDIPEAIDNTAVIAKRCAVMSETRAPMLPDFPCGKGRNQAQELKTQAEEGLKERLTAHVFRANMAENEKREIETIYLKRLHYELNIITDMKFPGYFLIVSDFIRWGKRNDIPIGPGRGSGAGSMVAWALQITDLDPIRFGLLFERFLNPERVSMPDFDIDFCQERREEVIRYVQEKYGHDKVAQIITFGKLQARAVLRDVGRVLQMSYGQIDRISKMIPFNPIDPVTLQKALEMDRDLREMRDEDQEVRKLIDIGMKLEGLNRHASTHAAGVVIADRPLEELVPVYRDPRSDMPVSGYSMKYTESSGLVKFDFLGLKTLTVIAKTCEFIARNGDKLDITKIALDDAPTYEMLTKGDSIGVFQLESAGMRDTLRKLRPDNIDDIIALISLYRPGPMDNIPSYIARKHGLEKPDYLDPMLEEVLKETYGVIIYQEQVMQIAQIMGGYSLGGADLLRRAMGKKIVAEMDAQRKIFVDGAVKNNVDKAKASAIFDLVAKFAGYGFNKSHAAAYAMISYQTAFLKANYPVEFLAASLNLDIHDTDKINTFCQEISRQDIPILLPNINQSEAYFVPERIADGKLGIRYGLGALKNVGIAAMELMVKQRNDGGLFKDIFDFVSRLDTGVLNKRQLENLVRSGSFDRLHDNRKQLFDSIEMLLKIGQSVMTERINNQSSLFGSADTQVHYEKACLVEVDDWKKNDRLSHEFAAIGLYLSGHPVDAYSQLLGKIGVISANMFFSKLSEGSSSIKVVGVVTSKRMRSSAKGRFATISLSDATGIFEVSIFDESLLTSARDLLENGTLLCIDAQARKDEGGVRIIAESIRTLEQILADQTCYFKIVLEDTNHIDDLKKVLGTTGSGKTRIQVLITTQDGDVYVTLPGGYKVDYSSMEALNTVTGVKKVLDSSAF